MSMFENRDYRWRETYFVLFRAANRPKLQAVQQALGELNDRYAVTNPSADDSGRFESLTLLSPDDYAALDICYTEGAEVREQRTLLAREIEAAAEEAGNTAALKRMREADARFDVLHFAQIGDAYGDEEEDEMLDPSALLLVLDALARLTDGVAVDPQGGNILSND